MLRQYTQRITQDAQGLYCWKAAMDKETERGIYVYTISVVCGISLFLCLFSIMLDWRVLAYTLPSCLVVIAVALGICYLYSRSTSAPYEVFRMNDDFIGTGQGRSSSYMSWHAVRRVIVYRDKFILKTRFRRMKVFVGAEDYAFVKGFILRNVPVEATIDYPQDAK